jgi:hypothetical protein
LRRLSFTIPLLALVLSAAPAQAAGPPLIGDVWAVEVVASSAKLSAEVTPNGSFTSYRFDYLTEADYEANLAAQREPYFGAAQLPVLQAGAIGTGPTVTVSQRPTGLAAETAYRYRVRAENASGSVASSERSFRTRAFAPSEALLDNRAWELVSPPDKNGGQIDAPEGIFGGGVFQAAAGGGRITYSSASAFGPEAVAAPQGSQYVSTREGGGWATRNITTPMVSGSYGAGLVGVPYQLFSEDLERGLLLNGRHCRDGGEGCPVENPPLPGTAAPPGFQDYYLRDGATGGFATLLTGADLANTAVDATHFHLALAGGAPDLRHVVLSTCAALTPEATEVPDGEGGCVETAANLYEWSEGQLSLVNLLPGDTEGTPGARLAAPAGAVSDDGARVYFTLGEDGPIYLREASATKLLPETVGGGAAFETASVDGLRGFFTVGGHLFRYDAATEAAADLTPAGGVAGVLGAAADGSAVYFQDSSGLRLWREGALVEVAPGAEAAQPSDYPPSTGTARVTADGGRLVFLSKEGLTGYDNRDQATGELDSQVFLFEAGGGGTLRCVSCNPTNERPIGPSSIPGAYFNGAVPRSVGSYKPRILVAGGRRLFFESADALLLGDTNQATDVFEWEAQGEGTCARPGGCLAFISSGRDPRASRFVDASADGSDAYFLTARSLVATDPGSVDLYDARVGGGFPIPPTPIPCGGDACQPLPSEPENPPVGSLVAGPGNPPIRFHKRRHRRHRHHQHRHHRKHQRSVR